MIGDFEAIGDAVTGGLLARSVEPAAGDRVRDGHTHEKNCLNCGARLTGPFCAECGQKAHIHRSVRAFFQDFVQGLFNFEGKIWRTLPMLALRPGEMTRRYIAGERARFISPVALYLFTVFAMFAALNFSGALGSGHAKNFREGLTTQITEDRGKIAKLQAQRTADAAAGENVSELDRKIAKRTQEITETEKMLSGQALSATDGNDETPGWLKPFIRNAQNNPELVSMKVQEAASKFSWLLIPISLPFMWLLFPFRRRYNTYDHAVFVTYSLSFMMLLVVTGSVLVALGFSSLAGLLFLVPPFHMYRHLKQSYELGRFSAVMRTMALVTFAFIAAGLFGVTAAAIGAM